MTGDNNTAAGVNALIFNTTGSNNIAFGMSAGQNLTTGDNNIDIGNMGVAGEWSKIRIGTVGTHDGAFITGISGISLENVLPVVIDGNGQLGTADADSLRGPKGDKGDPGDTGAPGPAGPDGSPSPAGPKGDTGAPDQLPARTSGGGIRYRSALGVGQRRGGTSRLHQARNNDRHLYKHKGTAETNRRNSLQEELASSY
jgi:hypothetical protein